MTHLKRLAALILCAALGAVLVLPAAADVLWVPEDDFYMENYEDCENLVQYFYTNGPKGFVAVSQAPGRQADTYIENGKAHYVSVTYTDSGGTVWGLVEFDAEGNVAYGEGRTGWVDMDDMLLVYDYQSFAEDHASEFENPGDMQGLEYGVEYVLWKYPGSGIKAGSVAFDQEYSDFAFDQTYTGEDGRLWGFVGYYLGRNNAWICISAPQDENLTGREVLTGTLVPAAAPDPAAPSGQTSAARSPYVIAAAAALAIIAAAVLVGVLRKRRRS